ncbi:ankyrin [Zopfia rhizophila CBS 207.26]|uniref:Ankyrin n=1 Tax=Zopfia rhizophila CBS 207.26 TaxID=1314779 RepID=A0A6A6DIB4_9PEZI|nr:ankyrin [Zopfia rhizophila CBS 207.26]
MAFVLSFSLRRMRVLWPNLPVLGGGINFVNLVPVESKIIVACKKGDLVAVRDIFRQRKAAPNNMSEEDRTLLWVYSYATQSDSTEPVRFLINAGSSIRSNTLLAESNWKQPEIARLFLHGGVNVEVVGAGGFTAAFYLFGLFAIKTPQAEFIEILACNSFSNFNAQVNMGWSALHRAAAFGTLADVKKLVQIKASINCRTHNLNWIPLFCAMCFRNLDTLQELWKLHDEPKLKYQHDHRGWNPLHVATGVGNFEAVSSKESV